MTGNCAVILRYHPFIQWAKSSPVPSGCGATQRQRTPCCLIHSSPGNRHLFLTRLTGELEPRTAAIRLEEGVQPLTVHRSRRPWGNLRPTHTSQSYLAHVRPLKSESYGWWCVDRSSVRGSVLSLLILDVHNQYEVDYLRKPTLVCLTWTENLWSESVPRCFALWGEKKNSRIC